MAAHPILPLTPPPPTLSSARPEGLPGPLRADKESRHVGLPVRPHPPA